MNHFFLNHFDTILMVFITILGFIITYFMTRKNFRDEVKKGKITLNAEAIKSLPYEICQMMNRMLPKGKQKLLSVDEYSEILSKVLSYGSKDTVAIAIHMQQLSYSNADGTNAETGWEMISSYSLLITQIKYDLTSEIISPESWFYLKISDYKKLQPQIKATINKVVNQLRLNKEFHV